MRQQSLQQRLLTTCWSMPRRLVLCKRKLRQKTRNLHSLTQLGRTMQSHLCKVRQLHPQLRLQLTRLEVWAAAHAPLLNLSHSMQRVLQNWLG